MTNPRTRAKIEARIRERAAYCIEFEMNDPRAAFITITGTEISNDLSIAKIFYSVYGSEGEKSKAAHMLEDASGFVRKQVGRVLKTRRIPQIRWIYDDAAERQEEIERAITSALQTDRDINPEAHAEMGELVEEEPSKQTFEVESIDEFKDPEEGEERG